MSGNGILEKYIKEKEVFYEFLSTRQRFTTFLVDRSHYCNNGNICPTYICGNCGNSLILPWSSDQKKCMVITHDWILCSVCNHINYTYNIKRECTYES